MLNIRAMVVVWFVYLSYFMIRGFSDDFMCPTFGNCVEKTPESKAELDAEIADYEKGQKFMMKINESQFHRTPNVRFAGVLHFLKQHALAPNQSVLDLGCAAGAFLRFLNRDLVQLGGAGRMAGVELTKGWIDAAKKIHPTFSFIAKDITEVSGADFDEQKFDLITLIDVFEHVQRDRYACLFKGLQTLARPYTLLYFHLPTSYTQILTSTSMQYFENVIHPHSLIAALACFDFQLDLFEYNKETVCGLKSSRNSTRGNFVEAQQAKCKSGAYPRYMHLLFHYDPQMSMTRKHAVEIKKVG